MDGSMRTAARPGTPGGAADSRGSSRGRGGPSYIKRASGQALPAGTAPHEGRADATRAP
jgi:hypothetical protein